MQKWLFTQCGWITSGYVAYFPLTSHIYWLTCRLLFPAWLLPKITLAIICRNGSEHFQRTLLTVLTACLYHSSLFSLHSLHFPPLSFISLLPPSFSPIHLFALLTFIRLHLFSFILIHSPSFTFIHTRSTSLTFNSSP